jgi:hypothetical protein
MMPLRNTVTPLHCSPLQNATISNMKSNNCNALQKKVESDSFLTDSVLHAQLCCTVEFCFHFKPCKVCIIRDNEKAHI